MTADQIHDYLRSEGLNIGIATVYRNLNVLYQDGLINRIKHPDLGFVYDRNINVHHHFICKKCGYICDLKINLSEEQLDEVKKQINGEIKNYEIIFEGMCNDCLMIKHLKESRQKLE